MGGTDGVFHIAGWYKIGTRDQIEGERINVTGTRNVLSLGIAPPTLDGFDFLCESVL